MDERQVRLREDGRGRRQNENWGREGGKAKNRSHRIRKASRIKRRSKAGPKGGKRPKAEEESK